MKFTLLVEACARAIAACAGFLLETVGASTPVAATFICVAVLLVGTRVVLEYVEYIARYASL